MSKKSLLLASFLNPYFPDKLFEVLLRGGLDFRELYRGEPLKNKVIAKLESSRHTKTAALLIHFEKILAMMGGVNSDRIGRMSNIRYLSVDILRNLKMMMY
jgi:hypothetical protein